MPAPAVSEDAARAVVSSDLEVLTHQLALIPTGGEYEVLCHEFKCRTPEDTHVIVYVNAATGSEEKILLLVEDETGTLVW
ncbi:MAG: germination protein YpeB, partial [Oscillospiraceae bacterium]